MPRLFKNIGIVSRSIISASLLAMQACSSAGSYVWVQDVPSESATPGERIGAGDLLNIRVFGQEAVSTRGRVRPDGTFTLPLLGEIEVTGKKPAILAKQLEKQLTPFINAPSVTVVIEEAPVTVTVMGEVKTPTVAQLEPPPTVIQALARAGGLTEFADEDDIYVLRQTASGSPERIRFTYLNVLRGERGAAQFRLKTGDIVVVE
jgi:polysaccharide biosynthesis/export protein